MRQEAAGQGGHKPRRVSCVLVLSANTSVQWTLLHKDNCHNSVCGGGLSGTRKRDQHLHSRWTAVRLGQGHCPSAGVLATATT